LSTLAEELGYSAEASLLIVSCDELGVSHANNIGVYSAIREGIGKVGGLVVPAPWAREAASRYRGEDIGVHLTLNAEYDLYRWGPITHCPSLLDGDGGFPRTVDDLWDHADTDEVHRECRAQIERAIYWGFDVSHLSSHLGSLGFRPEFFDVALDLAVEFGLPLRLPDATAERQWGFPFRTLAAEQGVLSPDRVIEVAAHQSTRRAFDHLLGNITSGVTEVVLRPAIDTAELRAVAPDWPARVADHDLGMDTDSGRALTARAGVHLIGYRELRDLQRERQAQQI
jgi:predicted glycoside hydrolase/deacetylase ChbG (UPF0249 family)